MVPTGEDLAAILLALKNNSNYDLSNYSLNSLSRRFGKILVDLKLEYTELLEKINSDPVFIESLIKKVTVNTTELFRDPQVWANLYQNILPSFEYKDQINIWHPGCSTGQEVYSMMICLDKLNLLNQSQIFASDINNDVLEISKKGEYKSRFNKDFYKNYVKSFNADENIEEDNYEKYFILDKLQDKIQVRDFLLQKPIYKKIDLVNDGNLFNEKFDLIICRNVIIYFNYDLQKSVLNMFHENMRDNSCIVLGIHESIISSDITKFTKKNGVYFKL